jgi:hypothetical protein
MKPNTLLTVLSLTLAETGGSEKLPLITIPAR